MIIIIIINMYSFTCCVNVMFVSVCLQERQKQLESLGISLQSSGIKVGDDKSFLVNLNADPALNELLVYYLKVHTKHYYSMKCHKLLQQFLSCYNLLHRFEFIFFTLRYD